MSKLNQKKGQWVRRKNRVAKKLHGTAARPRLSVYRSNTHIYAQLIDDDAGTTLAAASTREKGVASQKKDDLGKKGIAKVVGKQLAEKATAAGVTQVVFDRNGFRYHGRLAALASGAREGGLKF